jgi:tRNA threonylcarbamoyladenosine biosynthesis protein TsaE
VTNIVLLLCSNQSYCTLKKKSLEYAADSDDETIKLGRKLGALLAEGDVIALVGELGSGKTWFAKGLALGLGVDPHTVITSPSFAFVNEYQGRHTFFHMDIYRLESLAEFISAGLEEYLYDNGSVVAMEWADRWPEILPEQSITVEFVIIDENLRKITVSGHHPRSMRILEAIGQEPGPGNPALS